MPATAGGVGVGSIYGTKTGWDSTSVIVSQICFCSLSVRVGNIGSETISFAKRSETGKSPSSIPEVTVGLLQVQRDGIVNARTDVVGG